MAKKSGFLAILVLGVIIGISLGKVILIAQNYTGKFVLSLLNDQVKESIPHCELLYDDYHISFLRRNGYANNPRIVCNKKNTVLFFRQIRANFNIKDILKKKIVIEKLILDTGHSEGISPLSETYKFVDYLIQPNPNANPNDIQISLKELLVFKGSFEEKLTKTVSLKGQSVKLRVFQDEKGNFTITPFVKELYIYHKPKHFPTGYIYNMGDLYVDIFSPNNIPGINIKKFLLEGHGLTLNGTFDILQNNDIQNGSWHGNFNSKLLSSKFAKLFSFDFLANGKITNNIISPIINGTIKINDNSTKNAISISNNTLYLDELFATVNSGISIDNSFLKLKNISFNGTKISGSSIKDLIIDKDNFSTKLKFHINNLEYSNVKLNDIDGIFELSGNTDQYDISFLGNINSIDGLALKTPSIKFLVKLLDNNILDFSVQSKENINGNGRLNLNRNGECFLENFNLNINNVPLKNSLTKMNWYISSDISLFGPLSLYTLEGSASLFLHSQDFNGESTLKGSAKLKDGKILGDLTNPLKSFETKLTLNLKDEFDSNLKINLKKFNPNQYSHKLGCVDITSNLEYDFNIKSSLEGKGFLFIKNLALGCDPYRLELKKQKNFTIKNGILNFDNFYLYQRKNNNSLAINGSIDLNKNININIDGNFNLNSFISFFPFVDILSGNIDTKLTIKGKTFSPKIDGKANIKNGSIVLNSSNINITKLNSNLILNGSLVETQKTNAKINDGKAVLNGNLNLLDFSKSKASIKLSKVNLPIDENTYSILSGNLNLLNDNQQAKLSGNIHIDTLEFIKNITLTTVLNFIKKKIFVDFGKMESSIKKDILNIILDLNLTSNDDIHIKTDWIDATFSSKLKVIGTSKTPIIIGKIVGTSGWFGLRNKKFLINSAIINFQKDTSPTLDIVGEAYLRNASGDNSLIICNILGNVEEPIIQWTSDSGLSQKEILNLLLSGENLTKDRLSGLDSKSFVLSLHSFINSPSIENFKNIFNALTSIDNLSIVSKYNIQTGVTEPAVIAEKKITDNISAIGESFISGSSSNAKISLIHYLSPKIFLESYFETLTTHSNSAVGIDINYNILSSNNTLISYEFLGNKTYSATKLRDILRINDAKFIEKKQMRQIRKKLKEYYISSGFLDVKIKSIITLQDKNIIKIKFIILEGKRYKIHSLNINSKKLNSEILNKLNPLKGKYFTNTITKDIQKEVRSLLKNSGYLSARILLDFKRIDNENIKIKIAIKSFKKYSFNFSGNSNFSDDDLLDTIYLNDREYPFGSNIINMLVEGIENLYRKNGYLFSSVKYKLNKNQSVYTYNVTITEESICLVNNVFFSGNKKIDSTILKSKIKKLLKRQSKDFLAPKYVIHEKIEENSRILANIYEELGFPNVKINYKLKINNGGTRANITYLINEGEEKLINKLIIIGIPDELNNTKSYFENISTLKENKIIKNISENLNYAGYYNHQILKDKSQKEKVIFKISLGKKIIINDIKIIGNKNVDAFTIFKNLHIKKGEFYSENKIVKSKKLLLQLGLFNNIKFSLVDIKNNKNKKDLIIEVEERMLNSLAVGLGVNSEYGMHILTKATNKSLFKDGKTISLSSDIFYDGSDEQISQGSTDLKFIEPSLFGSQTSFSKEYRYQKLTTSLYEFELDRYTDGLSFYFPMEEDLYFYFGQNFTIESLDNVSKDAIIGNYDDGKFNLSYLLFSMKYDKRDNILNPKDGFAFSLEYKLANKILLSDAEFQTISLRANAIFPFYDDFNFSLNNYTGASFAYNDTTQVPISQRFYLGGINSIRGFKENSLGPRGEDGSVIGGDIIFSNNAELNYFLLENFSVHTFLDFGNVFLRDLDNSSNELRYSTGLGARFNLPIGPIGLDIAFPINPKHDEDSWRLHFSIGTGF